MFIFKTAALIAIFIVFVHGGIHDNVVDEEECNLLPELVREIQSYEPTVQKIINATLHGRFKGATYNELAKFVDKFGARFTGTKNLEESIDYMIDLLKDNNLDNVHGEEVPVPHWIRGTERAHLLEPRVTNISVLGLGYNAGTPPGGIEAEVLVVRSFDELNLSNFSSKAKGKIIVFNYEFVSYGVSVQYRSLGATRAAEHGGVAALVRSVTPFSMSTLHTGMQSYRDNVTHIPVASITVEAAHMMQRLQDRGEKIVMSLVLEAQTHPDTTSRNTVAEIEGSEKPDKVVIVSGHLDSWDVGVGAMDDGGGAFISWYSLVVLRTLGLRPRRTIRAVLWTAEEMGLVGAIGYNKTHRNELDNLNFVMESDEGTFTPLGIQYSAGPQGGCILEEIMKLLGSLNATAAQNAGPNIGSDITIWTSMGIPGASLYNENEKYFWYHHSPADTMDVENPDTLDKATALWAAVSYVVADLSIDFPREVDALHPKSKGSLLLETLANRGMRRVNKV